MTQQLSLLIEQHLTKAIQYEVEAQRTIYLDPSEEGEQRRDELLELSQRAFAGALALEASIFS